MNDKKVSTTAERLKEYMEVTGDKQVDMLEKIEPVAKRCGEKFNKSHLSNYISGRFTPKQNKIYVLSRALEVSPSWLMGYDVPMELGQMQIGEFIPAKAEFDYIQNNKNKPKYKGDYTNTRDVNTKTIPLVGKIACGTPIVANEEYQYIGVDSSIQADFAVIAQGDSMIGARILDGDTVFIRAQPDVENGEVAAVGIDDEVTLKRIYKKNGSVMLVAENPAYEPMIYTGEDLDHIHILGKAVSFNSKIK